MLTAALALQAALAVPLAPPAAAGRTGMLVVAPATLAAGLVGFVAARARERPARLETLEAIVARHPGADDAERLKHRLFAGWRDEGLRYVLLVGDGDVLPVRYMVLDRVTEPACHYAFYPSDLYYADVARADGSFEPWNARADGFHAGYFGEVRGEHHKAGPINYDAIHYLPELAVGRWPVSDGAEVARVVRKTLAHAPGASARAALLFTAGWVDARPALRQVAAALAPRLRVEEWFEGDGGGRPPTAAATVALLREGVDLVLPAGHGEPHGFERGLGVRDLSALAELPCLPVVLSAGCSTAYFAPLPPYEDYEDATGVLHRGTNAGEVFTAPPPPPAVYQRQGDRTGIGEALLVASEGGSVAYFGCNTGSQPCGLTLVTALAVHLGAGATLGDAWAAAVADYFAREGLAGLVPTESWYPPSIFFQGMKFMVFGDPTLRIVR